MMRWVRSVSYHWRHGGVGGLLRGVLGKVRRLLSSEERWYVYRRPAEGRPEDVLPDWLDMRELDFDELVALGFFKAVEYPEAVRARYGEGERCFGFFVDGDLAHVAWLAPGRLPFDVGLPVRPEPAAAAIYDCLTFPAFRRRGIYGHVLRALIAKTRTLSLPEAVIAVDPDNVPSRRAIENAGFVLEAEAVARRRLGFTSFLWRDPQSRP